MHTWYLLYLLWCLVYHMLLRYYCYVCWWCKIPYSSCIFNTGVVVACVIFIHGFFWCRGYWIWVFCCLFVVCIYTCLADYVELPVLLYLLQCLVYHMLSKMRRSSGIYILGNRWGIGVSVIRLSLGRRLVNLLPVAQQTNAFTLGLLVVVYKIPVQQLYVNQARCNWLW